jgi:hypothetical protein
MTLSISWANEPLPAELALWKGRSGPTVRAAISLATNADRWFYPAGGPARRVPRCVAQLSVRLID